MGGLYSKGLTTYLRFTSSWQPPLPPNSVVGLAEHGITEFHFYTMNQHELTTATCRILGIRPQESSFQKNSQPRQQGHHDNRIANDRLAALRRASSKSESWLSTVPWERASRGYPLGRKLDFRGDGLSKLGFEPADGVLYEGQQRLAVVDQARPDCRNSPRLY